MNQRIILLTLLLLLGSSGPLLISQTSSNPDHDVRLEHDMVNNMLRMKWWGQSGRTYFMESSDNLNPSNWNWYR